VEGFGPEKLIFILLIMVLIFGAKRLPEIGASLGKGIREFKKSVQGVDEQPVQMQPQAFANPVVPQALAPAAPMPPVVPAVPQRIETTQA